MFLLFLKKTAQSLWHGELKSNITTQTTLSVLIPVFHPEVFLQVSGLKRTALCTTFCKFCFQLLQSAKRSLSQFTSKYVQAIKVLVRGAAMFKGSSRSEEHVTHADCTKLQ